MTSAKWTRHLERGGAYCCREPTPARRTWTTAWIAVLLLLLYFLSSSSFPFWPQSVGSQELTHDRSLGPYSGFLLLITPSSVDPFFTEKTRLDLFRWGDNLQVLLAFKQMSGGVEASEGVFSRLTHIFIEILGKPPTGTANIGTYYPHSREYGYH